MILRKNLTLTAIDRRDNDSGNSDSISISITTGLLSHVLWWHLFWEWNKIVWQDTPKTNCFEVSIVETVDQIKHEIYVDNDSDDSVISQQPCNVIIHNT